MKQFKVNQNEAGQRFDKLLFKLLNKAPKSFIYKMLRKKNIVLNDKKSQGSEQLKVNDIKICFQMKHLINSVKLLISKIWT